MEEKYLHFSGETGGINLLFLVGIDFQVWSPLWHSKMKYRLVSQDRQSSWIAEVYLIMQLWPGSTTSLLLKSHLLPLWKARLPIHHPFSPIYGWETSSLLTKLIFSKGKATMSDRSEIIPSSKHLKVMDLRLSDAGIYTCEYESHTVSISLHVFKCEWLKGFCPWRGEVGEDFRAQRDLSAEILYPAAISSVLGRAEGPHILFAVTLVPLSQEE